MKKIILIVCTMFLCCATAYSQYGRNSFNSFPIRISVETNYGLESFMTIADSYYSSDFDELGFYSLKITDVEAEPMQRYLLTFDGVIVNKDFFMMRGEFKVGYEKTSYKVIGTKSYLSPAVERNFEYNWETTNIAVGPSMMAVLNLLDKRLNIGLGAGFVGKIPLGDVPMSYAGMTTERVEHIQLALVAQAKVSFYLLDNLFVSAGYGLDKNLLDAYYGLSAGEGLKLTSSFLTFGIGYDFQTE